jgi:hypothetical protein
MISNRIRSISASGELIAHLLALGSPPMNSIKRLRAWVWLIFDGVRWLVS